MKQTEHAAARLIEWLQEFKAEAIQRGKIGSMTAIYIGLYHDGAGTITIGSRTHGSSCDPISLALREATNWLLARDDAAEQNATLGLMPEGKFRDEPAAAYYRKDLNFQDPFKCPF